MLIVNSVHLKAHREETCEGKCTANTSFTSVLYSTGKQTYLVRSPVLIVYTSSMLIRESVLEGPFSEDRLLRS